MLEKAVHSLIIILHTSILHGNSLITGRSQNLHSSASGEAFFVYHAEHTSEKVNDKSHAESTKKLINCQVK